MTVLIRGERKYLLCKGDWIPVDCKPNTPEFMVLHGPSLVPFVMTTPAQCLHALRMVIITKQKKLYAEW